MSLYTVYGLRLCGEREVRYVGLTRRGVKHRLRTHIYQTVGLQVGTPLGRWLSENRENVEIFEIAGAGEREAAKETERAVVALCLRMNQRLFNQVHVPSHLRLVA